MYVYNFQDVNEAYANYKKGPNPESYKRLLKICSINFWLLFRNRYVMHNKVSEVDAQDLTTEMLVSVHEHLKNNEREYEDFASYWFKAADRHFVQYSKSTRKWVVESIETVADIEAIINREFEKNLSHEKQLYLLNFWTKLFHEVLNSKELQVMDMVLDGKTHNEISRTLEISSNYVSTIKNRAVEKLKVYVKENNIRPGFY
ncbi:MAG: sigma-70 family RNA polymerase sigma factor [Bacteroidia bacterium]|nr:sigma-70 family RNA polymerase sigma factor [Bacteroidia bacterium]